MYFTFIGIILARPGSYKTVILNLLRQWYCIFYTDNFSRKAFQSHMMGATEEVLNKIDMLPKIKNKHFLTPELAPIFTTDGEELLASLGIITRIADGHGLATDSGTHGHREYGDTMFVWTGAAVDVPYKVYKLLGNLGFKIYFFRLPYAEKNEDELLEDTRRTFDQKKSNIESALYDYLGWFEIGPNLIYDEQSDLPKMRWDYDREYSDNDNGNNNKQSLRWIVKLAQLLAHLRRTAQTWTPEGDDQGQGSDYGFSVTQPEDPRRAIEVLKSLARGHALSMGRNFITLEDIPIVVKTVLSTAIIDRVGLLRLLIAKNGTLVTSEIMDALKVARKTALRTMKELWAVGLIDMKDDTSIVYTKRIILKEEFQWLLNEDFQKLLEGFEPVDNRAFMKAPKVLPADKQASANKCRTIDSGSLVER